MRRVGMPMQLKPCCVDRSVVLYIVLDHTGRHDADLCICQYNDMLRAEFNINLIHQVRQSIL